MHNPQYISKIYHKYEIRLTKCGNYRTPMAVNTRLTKSMCPTTDSEKDFMSKIPYRPDLSYAVNQVAKSKNNHGTAHWER